MTLDFDNFLAVEPSQFRPFNSSIVYALYSWSCDTYSELGFHCIISLMDPLNGFVAPVLSAISCFIFGQIWLNCSSQPLWHQKLLAPEKETIKNSHFFINLALLK